MQQKIIILPAFLYACNILVAGVQLKQGLEFNKNKEALLNSLVAVQTHSNNRNADLRQFNFGSIANGIANGIGNSDDGGGGGVGGAIIPNMGLGGMPISANQFSFNGAPNFGGFPVMQVPGCPLCDASVFTYCSHKMIHDACCCDFPVQQQVRPPQCLYYNCGLLYAKSCYEHGLIKNCCCNNPY